MLIILPALLADAAQLIAVAHQALIGIVVPQQQPEFRPGGQQPVRFLRAGGWRDLEAVKNGRCTYLSKDLFHYKPNARWAEAYRVLAGLLYPESFS